MNEILFEDRQDPNGKWYLQISTHVRSDVPIYWKRSGGWQWDGQERWWEYYVEFQNGWNGGGGLCGRVLSRWNNTHDWHFREPFNWSSEKSREVIEQIEEHFAINPDAGNSSASEQPEPSPQPQ